MSNSDYLTIMMAKLVDALLRKDSEQDGNWGYPSFHAELREMQKALWETEAVRESNLIMDLDRNPWNANAPKT